MEKFDADTIAALSRCPLFARLSDDELRSLLGELDARRAEFSRGERILRAGQTCTSLGIVVSGKVTVLTEDFWGNTNILAQMGPGELFGESFACIPATPSTVSVVAEGPCVVMFVDVRSLVDGEASGHESRDAVVLNLLGVLARKNIALTQKTEHLTRRSTREKVLAYLSSRSQLEGSAEFDIPFNRQQLADYLSVERSALSTCLGKMRDDGIIEFRKSHFRLL